VTLTFVLSLAVLAGVVGGWVYGGARHLLQPRTTGILIGLTLLAALFAVSLLAGCA
jgi:hypothetical protein